jgi:hypothetical protein
MLAASNKAQQGAEWARTVALFEDMPHKGLQPNDVSYGCLMHAYALGLQADSALQLLKVRKCD